MTLFVLIVTLFVCYDRYLPRFIFIRALCLFFEPPGRFLHEVVFLLGAQLRFHHLKHLGTLRKSFLQARAFGIRGSTTFYRFRTTGMQAALGALPVGSCSKLLNPVLFAVKMVCLVVWQRSSNY